MVAKPPLTPPQQLILITIDGWVKKHGWAPTLREICAEVGFASHNAARQHVTALVRKGYVRRGKGARALKVVY